jgi:tetratricopeptide (TPR) repeat protein
MSEIVDWTEGSTHLAFLDAMDRRFKRGENDAHLRAAFLTLRLVDGWLAGDRLSDWGMQQISQDLDQLLATTLEVESLRKIVDSLMTHHGNQDSVSESLVSYARVLEDASKWPLAEDVYRTAIAACESIDSARALYCTWRIGFCYINEGTLPRADEAFSQCSRLARRCGDFNAYCMAQLGLAHVEVLRGNLASALRITNQVLGQGVRHHMRDVQARAMHGLTTIAMFEDRFEDAMVHAASALTLHTSDRDLQRVKSDMGFCLMSMGLYEAARYLYCDLASRGKELFLRKAALCNLLAIAERSGNAEEFEVCCAKLDLEDSPPYLAAAARLTLGEGYLKFQKPEIAHSHLEAAIALASEHGFGQIKADAERAMVTLRRNVAESCSSYDFLPKA